jgi:predicted dehydrogenase
MSKPRAIVAGTGFGCRIHVPALRAAGFEVAALVGADAERTRRRAEAAGVAASYTDLSEAIAATGAVTVTIATPPGTHARLTLDALARGCHVLCEKPLAFDAAEAQAMLEAARETGVSHLVGNEFRWSPARETVRRAIASGLIGQPRFVTMNQFLPLVADPAARMPRWWFDEGAGGGWLGASGSHAIDTIRSWLGEFASLSAVASVVSAREGGADDSFALRFRMENGAEGVMQQTAASWGPPVDMVRISGTLGTVWIEQGVVGLATCEGVRELPADEDLALPALPATDDPRQQMAQFGLGEFIRLCEALRAGVEGRLADSAVPVPTFQDGLAAMVVIDAIRRSSAQGGALIVL